MFYACALRRARVLLRTGSAEEDTMLHYTRFYEGDALPDASGVDMLIIMGGPMNVFDYHVHSWMQDEIEWVKEFIETGKPVLGICLGAQIIAAALGEEVYPGPHKGDWLAQPAVPPLPG